MGRLDGMVAAVTGAGSGIGRGTALACERGRARVTRTNQLRHFLTDLGEDEQEAMFAVAGQQAPMGRYGSPEEIGRAIAFLASPEAFYITGATLPVDGGGLAR